MPTNPTVPTEPVPVTPTPEPTPTISVTPDPTLTPEPSPDKEPDSGIPYIKDESGNKGWTSIYEETSNAEDEATITVDMNGTTAIVGEIFTALQGRYITMVFEMGNSIAWSINGRSVVEDEIADIDLGVSVGTDAIPNESIEHIAREHESV